MPLGRQRAPTDNHGSSGHGDIRSQSEDAPQFIGRVQALCADTPRQWGTMDVTRMLRHLNFSTDMSLGVEQVEDLSTPIVRGPDLSCSL